MEWLAHHNNEIAIAVCAGILGISILSRVGRDRQAKESHPIWQSLSKIAILTGFSGLALMAFDRLNSAWNSGLPKVVETPIIKPTTLSVQEMLNAATPAIECLVGLAVLAFLVKTRFGFRRIW